MAKPRKTVARTPLSASRIVVEALALVDAGGLEAFSFRALATRLGCEAMSIYHYFPNRQHLFDAMVEQCIGEMEYESVDGPWLARLREGCHAFRKVALRHPGFFAYFGLYRMNSRAGIGFLDRFLRIIEESGLDDGARARHFRAIGYYLVGAGLDEALGYAKGPSAAEPLPDEIVARDFPAVVKVGRYFGRENHISIFEEGLETLLRKLAEDAAAGGT
jgi:AcrR family transcriptional regulator